MLNQVKINNFRCFKSVSVPMRPLTVLVGPNDTGKSAFLAAVHALVNQTGLPKSDFPRFQDSAEPSVHGQTTKEGGGSLTLYHGNWRRVPDGGGTSLQPVARHVLPSGGALLISAGESDDAGPPELTEQGEKVPTLLDHLLRCDRKRFDEYVKAMGNLVPGLENIHIRTPHPAKRRIDLVVEKGLVVPGDQTSAGVRLLLFFVALAYHPTPPKLILLEEPETGVHPRRLAEVMRLLREITEGKHGSHAAQVILTTHSPYLLDHVNPETDQVLVFQRDDDGTRSVQPADPSRLKDFLDEFMLGEVWFNQGEAGLVARGT